jgi:protein-tyrosine phosphatase
VTRCLAPSCKSPATIGPFCELHAKAPAGQRGGWLSAAKRKPYDATVIAPRLWIGAKPPFDKDLPKVDMLVLCAAELQPESIAFHGTIARCPIPDGALDATQARLVMQTAVVVAQAIVAGKRVLVTCHMGLNRSALVIALALHQLTTMNHEQIVEHIRRQRSLSALGNKHFVAIIERVVGDGRAKVRRRQSDQAG